MTDRMAVVVAVATVAGACLERGPSPWVGAALAVVALVLRRPIVLAVAALALAAGLAARAEAGLVPVHPGPFEGTVTMLADPEPVTGDGVRFDVRTNDGRHLEAVATAPTPAGLLRTRAAGQQLRVRGRLERAPPGSDWLVPRHVVGRLSIDDVVAWSPGGLPARAANAVRATLARGAMALDDRQRPLFLGFVLGDTRGQLADVTDDFRASGLSHLLAVSGENVAFVLALAGPLLRRIAMRPRFVATIGVIAFFALVTRFEPSVLRASAMAALAASATVLGREASRLRLLALAVASLVLLDPFLVRTVGFQLSVAASAGIVLLTPPLARALPGPRPFADGLAVTIGAQAGVAPLLVAVFGGVPLATIPANLLAAPAAGTVMVWGTGAGLIAGVTSPAVASVLHLPTRLLIGWIAAVAHRSAVLPLGSVGARELLVAGIAAAVLRYARGLLRTAALAGLVVALVAPVVARPDPPDGHVVLGAGADLWRSRGATLLALDGRARLDAVFEGLRNSGQRDLDIVVVRTAAAASPSTISALRRWGKVGHVAVPPGIRVDGATAVTSATELDVDALQVLLTPDRDRLLLEFGRAPPV